ncbi:MAG: hypothetical protein IH986_15860 [Planctomycetes bacterium]|nr:hypothetical protein [Planctomycetota bacterium]
MGHRQKLGHARWLRDRLRQWNESQRESPGRHAIVETVWFDPWKYQTREDVWRGLIAEVILACLEFGAPPGGNLLTWIERAAKQFGAKIGRPFLAALNHINVKLKVGTPQMPGVPEAGGEIEIRGEAFQAVIDEYNKAATPEAAYLNEFEASLASWVADFFPQEPGEGRAPRRLALFIDDLDRCMPAVALQVLEALKLYLNIPGLLFVVGLDRQVLDAVVQTEYAKHGVTADKSREYLDKMFQVHLDIPPTQRQAHDFLEQQIKRLDEASGQQWSSRLDAALPDEPKVDCKAIIESKIAVLARDNPREIKRLLNSVLLRAWAAAHNTNLEADADAPASRALRFTQGAQVFLIQRFLGRGFEREDLLLTDETQRFFERWSNFVRDHPDFQPAERAELSADAAKDTDDESAAQPQPRGKPTSDARRPERQTPAEAEFEQLRAAQPAKLPLLADKHLWELMRIPFSVSVAAVSSVAPAPSAAVVTARTAAPARTGADRVAAEPAEAPTDAGGLPWPRTIAVAIARALDKPLAELTPADADKVRKLDLIGNTLLSDLMPLAGLTGLRALDLRYCSEVSDLMPLAGLSALQVLHLGNTQVSDLKPLVGLSALRLLELWGTRVSDLTPLAELNGLQSLDLEGTPVFDLTPLAGLSGLQLLDLHRCNQVSDLTPLAGLSGLKSLDLRNTQVSDLAPLEGLSGLRKLWIDPGVDDTSLKKLPNLQIDGS